MESLLGGIETGGTTFVVSIAHSSNPTKIVEKKVIPTKTPAETIPAVAAFFEGKNISALGIASFGPIDINKNSKTYGFITTTPKKTWQNFDLVGQLRSSLQNGKELPIEFSTDVNAAALAESLTAGHKNASCLVYITVGGGVGVGISYKKAPFLGLSHGEGGHIKTPRFIKDGKVDTFEGVCAFHKDCVEGLCCVAALSARSGVKPEELSSISKDNEIWDYFAFYMGQLCATITLMLCPDVIAIGGGVLQRTSLFPKIRKYCLEGLGGYISLEKITQKIEQYIVPAYHDDNNAGVVGSLVLASSAFKLLNKTAIG